MDTDVDELADEELEVEKWEDMSALNELGGVSIFLMCVYVEMGGKVKGFMRGESLTRMLGRTAWWLIVLQRMTTGW